MNDFLNTINQQIDAYPYHESDRQKWRQEFIRWAEFGYTLAGLEEMRAVSKSIKYHCGLCGWEGTSKGLVTHHLEDYCPQCRAKEYLTEEVTDAKDLHNDNETEL